MHCHVKKRYTAIEIHAVLRYVTFLYTISNYFPTIFCNLLTYTFIVFHLICLPFVITIKVCMKPENNIKERKE
jgi:hypothetical protein